MRGYWWMDDLRIRRNIELRSYFNHPPLLRNGEKTPPRQTGMTTQKTTKFEMLSRSKIERDNEA